MYWKTCYSVNDTSYSENDFQVLPAGVEPMTFCTPVECSTTKLQETRGSLGYITEFKMTNLLHTARINFVDMWNISISHSHILIKLILAVCGMFVTFESSYMALAPTSIPLPLPSCLYSLGHNFLPIPTLLLTSLLSLPSLVYTSFRRPHTN